MSMIRTVSYKASINADGSFYNESIEMSSEIDTMPLAQSQLEDARKRVSEMRQAIVDQHAAWVKESLEKEKAEQPKPAGQTNLEGGKAPANAGPPVKCIKCGAIVEPKTSQKGVEYSYCPKCKDNRRKDGTEFPPKKEA